MTVPEPRARAYPGYFIVLEGVDGCGSTTQSHRLVAALAALGHDARQTFEPTNGPIGGLIRGVLQKRVKLANSDTLWQPDFAALALLFAADRLDHLQTMVLPALQAGAVVVSDRYDLSSLAYQSVTAPDEGVVPWLVELNRRALRPDLTIVLDVSAEEAAVRRGRRGGDPDLFEVDSLQRQLVRVYDRAEQLVPGDALAHLSAEGDIDGVTERVLARVIAAFPALSARE